MKLFTPGSSTRLALILVMTGTAYAQPDPAATDPQPPAVETDEPASAAAAPPLARVEARPAPTTPPGSVDAATLDALIAARIAASPKTAGWNDGFFVQSTDGAARLRIGGITQFDGRFFVADSADPHVDQFGFRTIRPDLQGTLYGRYDFRLLPDFAGGKLVVQDAYVDLHAGEAVKVRFGKFKVPFGLERLQSEISTTFVERGLPTQLAPNRDLGVQLFGELAHGLVEYQLGVFNGVADGQSSDGDVSDDKEAAVRVFVKPFVGGPMLLKELGVGLAATFGDKSGTLVQSDVPSYKTQGQTTFFQLKAGTTLMDTAIANGLHWRATAQGHWYAGPVGVLSEYVRSAQRVSLGDPAASPIHERLVSEAWQVLGQWVLTGDAASFKSVTPKHAFDPGNGHWGAFDVAARIGELRVVDSAIFNAGLADPAKSARKAWSAGAGIDWFPDRSFRFVLDLERTTYSLGAKAGDRPAETSIVGRAQTVF